MRPGRLAANRAGDALLLRTIEAAEPDVVAFTVYLWNEARTLWLARELRKRMPETALIAGGPHAGQLAALGSGAAPLDWIGLGPGERIFGEMLRGLNAGRARTSPRSRGARPVVVQALPTDTGLAQPIYETAVLSAEEYQGIAWLETTRGCRFRCAYCQEPQRGGRREVPLPGRTLRRDLEALANLGATDICLLDAAVNASPLLPLMDELLGGRSDKPSISGAVRPELVSQEAAQQLARVGMVEAEVGVQAVDARVLRNIRRPARLSRVRDGIARLREQGIRVSADCILGLPGDTEATVRQTIAFVTNKGIVDRARFFMLSVLPQTHLRSRAQDFALEYQPYPPYAVTSTRGVPFGDLRSLYGSVLPSARPGRGLLPNPYALVRPPSAAPGSRRADGAHPVTHLVCDLDGPFDPTLVTQLSGELALEVHVWFSATDPGARLDEARELLSQLSTPNPFGVWHLVLETREPPAPRVAEALLQSVWYHNSPILVQHSPPRYRARVVFTPTRAERGMARGKFLAGKHLTGVPAVSESSFGKGRVQLCSIHIEMGDLSIFEWQAHMRQWLADHLQAQEGMESMEPGNRGHRLFMRARGGRWMRSVRESKGWRLLRAMVDELLEPR